jgi:hypothetical protein
MLASLSRKIFLIFGILYIFSACSRNNIEIMRHQYATQIICPDGSKFLVRFAYANEVKKAIENDLAKKISNKSNENFTVIRIPNIESFHIKQKSPEQLINCQINQDLYKVLYPNFIYNPK